MAADFEGRRSRDPRPYSEETFRKLGSWLMSEEKIEDARSLFSLQVEMDPGSSRAHYFLAVAARSLGDARSAREHFERALALTPLDRALSVAARERIEKAAREGLGVP